MRTYSGVPCVTTLEMSSRAWLFNLPNAGDFERVARGGHLTKLRVTYVNNVRLRRSWARPPTLQLGPVPRVAISLPLMPGSLSLAGCNWQRSRIQMRRTYNEESIKGLYRLGNDTDPL